jgi:MoaA/NifB/PqqE/SkfB family radical SAM enzyme
LPLSKYSEILNKYKKLGLESIFFTGGEPTLHKNFKEICDLTEDSNINFGLVSNAYSYEEYAEMLMKYKFFKKISFSINGLKKSHDRIRGHNSFRKVVNAIVYFKSRGVRVSIKFTIMNQNYDEIDSVVSHMANLGVEKLSFGAVVQNEANKDFMLTINQRKDIYRNIFILSEKYKIIITCSPSLWTLGGIDHCGTYLDNNHLYINERGELIYCCNIRDPYGRINTTKSTHEVFISERKEITSKLRTDRESKIKSEDLSPLHEHTCNYCNEIFQQIWYMNGQH